MNIKNEKIRKAIDAIKKERPDYGPILDLFGKIIIKQAEYLEKVEIKPLPITKDEARAKLSEGEPLLSIDDFQIDQTNASQLFRELCEILKSESKELSDGIEIIENALEKGDLNLEEVFQSVLELDYQFSELAESLSLDMDTILILVTMSIRPSLEATALQAKDMVEDVAWSKHYCPVCGSSPAISELRQLKPDGVEESSAQGAERIFYCSFCGTEWRTMRLICAFCGNTDQESLRYFYSESEKGYRIDVCDKCKGYIKTVDSREISHEIVPAVEDLATLHLDMVAEEGGYKKEEGAMPHSGM
jgi:FdhE protein